MKEEYVNLSKHKLPNFFIMKKQKNSPGSYNLGGNVFYVSFADDDGVRIDWGVSGIWPGGMGNPNISKIGAGAFTREYFEKEFYHINRLDDWKRKYIFKAIFCEENERIIHGN